VSTYNRVVAADSSASLAPTVRARLATEMADPTSEVGAYLSGTFMTQRARAVQTVGYLGDSLFPAAGYIHGEGAYWPSTARSILGMRYDDGIIAGVGSDTSAQILARVPDVIADPPSICLIHAGVNSIAAGVPATSVISDINAIVGQLRAVGIRPVVFTLTPSVYFESATLVEAGKVNNWIKSLPVSQGVKVIDWRSSVVDFASTTGAWVAAWTSDGVHPNDLGHHILGSRVARDLEPIITGIPAMVSDASTGQGLLSLNPGMTGSGGAKGAGVTGTVPANWTVNPLGSATVAASVEPRTDDVGGNWLKLDVTAGDFVVFTQNLAVGVDWAVGDTVWAETEILMVTTPVNLLSIAASLGFWNGLGFTNDSTWSVPPGSVLPIVGRPNAFVLRTPLATVPAGTERLQLFIQTSHGDATTGTYRLGRAAIRKAI